jgi:preprotein translocase subunit SecE
LAEWRSPKPQVGGSIPSWPANYLINMKHTLSGSSMKRYELISWLAIALVTVAAFFGTYWCHFAGPIKALVWIGWLVLTLGLSLLTSQGKQVFAFAKEAKVELQKVVWPTRQETIQTTSIVMIMVAVTGFVLWGIDSGMLWAIGKITHLG